jgi:membrane dipeptidase
MFSPKYLTRIRRSNPNTPFLGELTKTQVPGDNVIMQFIDMHCDTLMEAYQKGLDDLYETPVMLDIKRMQKAGALGQFFAIFMPGPGARSFAAAGGNFADDEYIAFCFNVFGNTMKKHGDCIAPALTGSDVVRNQKEGKMSAILTFEDGRPVAGSIENIDRYYEKGIRLVTLTWNGENCFGYPNSADRTEMARGLKPFGKEALLRMNELGIMIDVSHLSEGGFYDVAAISKKPFVASHSNCYALSPHQRNLTDEQIRRLAECGGVAGLNFCPAFLNADIKDENSTAAMISAHAKHLKNVGGIDCVGLGSDFDGITGKLEIGGVEKMPFLFDRFKADGFSGDEIEKIAFKNALRVMAAVMG